MPHGCWGARCSHARPCCSFTGRVTALPRARGGGVCMHVGLAQGGLGRLHVPQRRSVRGRVARQPQGWPGRLLLPKGEEGIFPLRWLRDGHARARFQPTRFAPVPPRSSELHPEQTARAPSLPRALRVAAGRHVRGRVGGGRHVGRGRAHAVHRGGAGGALARRAARGATGALAVRIRRRGRGRDGARLPQVRFPDTVRVPLPVQRRASAARHAAESFALPTRHAVSPFLPLARAGSARATFAAGSRGRTERGPRRSPRAARPPARSVHVGGGTPQDALASLLQHVPLWAGAAALAFALLPALAAAPASTSGAAPSPQLPAALDALTAVLAPAHKPLALLAAGMSLRLDLPPPTAVRVSSRFASASQPSSASRRWHRKSHSCARMYGAGACVRGRRPWR